MEDWGAGSSIGRPGQPSEVATSFVFLASSDASLYCMYNRGLPKIGYLQAHLLTNMYRWSNIALLPPG